MRKVLSSSYDVIHLFANLNNDERFTREARCSNVYFERGALYSYGRHFVLAKYVQIKKRSVLLISTKDYSVTTAKHKNEVNSATSHLERVFMPDAGSLATSLSAWQSEARQLCEKLKNARKSEIYITGLERLQSQIDKYFGIFGGRIPADLKKLLAIRNGAEYIKVAAKSIANQKRAAAAVAVKEAKDDAERLAKWRNGVMAKV